MGDQHAALGGNELPDVMAELMTSAPETGFGVPGWHAWLLLHVCMQLNWASPPAGYAALQKEGQLFAHVLELGVKVSMAPGGQVKPVMAAAGEDAAMLLRIFFFLSCKRAWLLHERHKIHARGSLHFYGLANATAGPRRQAAFYATLN